MREKEEITRWCRQAFQTARELEIIDPVERTTFVAVTCGSYAARKGLSEVDLSKWLKSNYSTLFVKNLIPGLELKDVRTILFRSYWEHKKIR